MVVMKLDDYHSFPESVDAFEAYGNISKIKAGDGIVRMKVEYRAEIEAKMVVLNT